MIKFNKCNIKNTAVSALRYHICCHFTGHQGNARLTRETNIYYLLAMSNDLSHRNTHQTWKWTTGFKLSYHETDSNRIRISTTYPKSYSICFQDTTSYAFHSTPFHSWPCSRSNRHLFVHSLYLLRLRQWIPSTIGSLSWFVSCVSLFNETHRITSVSYSPIDLPISKNTTERINKAC